MAHDALKYAGAYVPKKSASTVRRPMHMPPNAAAAGMYLKQERRSDGESGKDRTG